MGAFKRTLLQLVTIVLLTIGNHGVFANCPQGYTFSGGVCIPPTSTICPTNSIYQNGVCRYNSGTLCPTGSVYDNGVCTTASIGNICTQSPQSCAAPVPCSSCAYQQTCPMNTIMYQDTCVNPPVVQCPSGTILQNGICVRPNPCPPNTYYHNGVCVQIPNPDVVCPTGSHKVGNVCVQDVDVICPKGSTFINGKCVMEQTCDNGSFPHNGVCVRCPNDKIPTNQGCQPNIINTSITAIPPQPNEITNIVNVTNIANSSNVHNIITTSNNSNINNINLGSSSSSSVNSSSHESSHSKKEEHCCIVTEPRTCELVGGKYRCRQRRRHACGAECLQPNIDEVVIPTPIPPPPQPPIIIRPQIIVPPQPPIQPTIYVPPQPCTYQNTWPFLDCNQNSNIVPGACGNCNGNANCILQCQNAGMSTYPYTIPGACGYCNGNANCISQCQNAGMSTYPYMNYAGSG